MRRAVLAAGCALLAAPAEAQPTPPPSGTAPAAPPSGTEPAASPQPAATESTPDTDTPLRTGHILSLGEAVRSAIARHPALRIAQASETAATAQAGEAFAPLLPSVAGTASFRRSTQRGTNSFLLNGPGQDLGGTNFFQFGLTVSQLIYDFDQTHGRYEAAQENARAQAHAVDDQRLELTLGVKSAYFQARAQLALVRVSRDTLANQARHVAQVAGFVQVGTHPPIDLVQARADEESARLALVNAQNAYDLAKATLAEAMGLQETATFDVGDDSEPSVPGEDGNTATLFAEALQARPDVQAALRTIEARKLSVASVRGGYGPSLGATAGVTETGTALDGLVFNWSAAATLSWQLYSGGGTNAAVDEARANVSGAEAQLDLLRQQALLALEKARLGVVGAKNALRTAAELVRLSQERLTLAEGRYTTGIGTQLDVSDAQVQLTSALAQNVQAEYNLSIARAQLVRALGR
jgi:outer membrane protein